MRVCKWCNIEKPLSEYSLSAKAGSITKKKYVRRKDVYSTLCKECKSNQALNRYHNKNKEEKEEIIRKAKFRKIKNMYGLTESQYYDIMSKQDSVCAICKCQMEQACVDHCHTTGKVRGILCSQCNFALGQVKDNPLILRSMIDYLNDFI